MKKKTLLLLFITTINIWAQSPISKTVDSILVNYQQFLSPKILLQPETKIEFPESGDAIQIKDLKEYLKYIILLKNSEEDNSRFKGKINIGFQGFKVENSENFNISTKIALTKGVFPFQYEVNLGLRNQIVNGKVTESVSNVLIALDYDYNKELKNEFYAFLKRSSNNFLGIDQRYEVGVGHIFNFYSAKNNFSGMTEEGKTKLKEIVKNPINNKIAGNSIFNICSDGLCPKLKIDKSDIDNLKDSRKKVENIIKKKYSTTRLSLLLGLNYEIDKRKDSLKLYNHINKKNPLNGYFDSNGMYRFVIAPRFNWQGEEFTLNSSSYLKLGIFDSPYSNITSLDKLLDDEKTDYRIEFNNSLKVMFNEKTGLKLSYNLIYENAPPRKYFLTKNGSELFIADNKYSEVTLSLEMEF